MHSIAIQLAIDALLVIGFGVQHSLLATIKVKAIAKRKSGIATLGWRSVESLCNILYVLIAASMWQYTNFTVWRANGIMAVALAAVFCVSWVFYWYLHIVEYDCGLAFGSSTLVDQRAAQHQPLLENWTVGTRRWIRFPVHTAFFGMFLAIPHMTADLLLLGILANVYNVIGSVLYDKRLMRTIPEQWGPYVEKTGLIWPPVYRNISGAKDVHWPRPKHWDKPGQHIIGIPAGLILGLLYYGINGSNPHTFTDMMIVLLSGLLGSVVVGAILAVFVRPQTDSWDQNQTNLSTTDALASAIGVIVWAVFSVVKDGHVPNFGTFLPLWFTVQYAGHVFAYVFSSSKWHAAVQESE